MELQEPVKKRAFKKVDTSIKAICEEFVKNVLEKPEEPSLDELKKLLTEVYKNMRKKKTKDPADKKEPSVYNIFIKDEMKRIKETEPSTDNKLLMSMAASNWKEYKIKNNIK